MRIGINAKCLQKNVGRGTGRVLYNLLREWNAQDTENEFVLYFEQEHALYFNLDYLGDNFVKKSISFPVLKYGLLWENILLPFHLIRDKVDLFFSPSYRLPIFYNGPKCVIVHDISFHTIPRDYTMKCFLYDKLSFLSCLFAAKVITVSEFSKNEIVKHYGIEESKIEVIYSGIEGDFHSAETINQLPEEFNKQNTQYALYVGTIFNRRHVLELIIAWDHLLYQNKGLSLVIIGKNAIQPKVNLKHKINEINSRHGGAYIHLYDFVEEKLLLNFYSNCQLFIYPSSYEGFGLPPLEAMAAGKPVILGNSKSFPEIFGDAALSVNPHNWREIYVALENLISNDALKNNLVQKGSCVVEKFSWEKAAILYLKAFKDIFQKANGKI